MTLIKPAKISTTRLIAGLSRYANQSSIYYGEQNILTFDTYVRQRYVKKGDEKIMLITKGLQYRPDLVAHDVYGIPEAWWKIMEINNIFDIFDFKVGRTIILPNNIM